MHALQQQSAQVVGGAALIQSFMSVTFGGARFRADPLLKYMRVTGAELSSLF